LRSLTSSPDRAPRHLFDAWSDVARALERTPRLALFTDFDGTLTPIRRRASAVRLSDRIRELLRALARRGHVVGIVSGRGLDDLRARVGIPGVWYVAAHGFLIHTPDRHRVVLVSPAQRRLVASVARRLARQVRGRRGIEVEDKVAAIAVHHRNASPSNERAAHQAVAALVASEPGLRLVSGKKVWEVLPAAPVDKYRAVNFILRAERHPPAAGPRLAVYVGDDVADEAVFARLRGLTVAVGRRHDTLATYFVRSPAEVRELLARLDRGSPWTTNGRHSAS
jgi:alpha,alpha-trehalase